MLYEDLAGHAAFDGILFHDDALLSDYEDASAPAITAYQQAGFSGSLSEIRQNPEQFKQWTRFKSRALTDFTLELSARKSHSRSTCYNCTKYFCTSGNTT